MSQEKKEPFGGLLQSKLAEYSTQLQGVSDQIEKLLSTREQLKGAIFALQQTVAEMDKQVANNLKEAVFKESIKETAEVTEAQSTTEVQANG